MSDDLIGKVAALEVYVKSHSDKLKEIKDTIEDIYSKYDNHEKEYRDVLLQLQGVCSEFSEFSVSITELENKLSPIPEELHTHMTECKNYRDNDGFIKFWKNNPVIAGQFLFAGMIIAVLIIMLAQSPAGIAILKAGLGFFGIKI